MREINSLSIVDNLVYQALRHCFFDAYARANLPRPSGLGLVTLGSDFEAVLSVENDGMGKWVPNGW